MEKHINIPIFVPHEGCPNNCVFCNQHTITGAASLSERNIREEIENALSTYSGNPENAEIAFFGGSFTGIERKEMIRLLSVAYEYVEKGLVNSIRLSTRPDYIDNEILDILKSYGVTDIELGLQSMTDEVLSLCKRGHTAKQAENACKMILSHGFSLVGQMMIGLPGSTLSDELFTANEIVRMGCTGTRIYPTVVFENTELCEMAKSGAYAPLSVDEAVKRSAKVYSVFVKAGVKVLRIGLQSTEALVSGDGVFAGANHSALGELVISEYYYRIMSDALPEIFKDSKTGKYSLTIKCADGEQSKVAGQHKNNKNRLIDEAKKIGVELVQIKIIADKNVQRDTLEIKLN